MHCRFHLKGLDDLAAECRKAGVKVPVSEDLSVLGEKVAIGSRTAANRFAVQPMEGCDAEADGAPGELTFRRYKRYAEGGFGLIWAEATAVVGEGRSNPGQLFINRGNAGVFRRLVDGVKECGRKAAGFEPVLIIQLTHSGRYSRPDGSPKPIIAHRNPVLDPKHNLGPDYPVVTDEYLDRLQEDYIDAARLAAEAGFDGVDIKSCHRYLVSELLASFTREGWYGGSFENRTRFLREVFAKVRENVKPVFVTTRMNVYDAMEYPYGFGVSRGDMHEPDLAEPLELVGMLKRHGLPALNVSIGNPYFNPHYGRPFDNPVKGMDVPDEHPLRSVERFLGITRQVQKAFPDVPVVGSGYSWLRHLMPYVGAGVIKEGGASFLGIGRGAFAYPSTPKDVLEKGRMDPDRCCVTCSACTQIMRDGGKTGCVVRDGAVYGRHAGRAG